MRIETAGNTQRNKGGRPRALSDSQIARCVVLRKDPYNYSYGQIAEQMGCSIKTIERTLRGYVPEARLEGVPARIQQVVGEMQEDYLKNQPPVKSWGDISALGRECLLDFPRFCAEILEEPLYPHQVAWHEQDLEEERNDFHFNMRNAPPRHSKTDLYDKKVIWWLAGGGHDLAYYESGGSLRNVRVMLVSGTENENDKNFSYIEIRLATHRNLIETYGRFKQMGYPWRPSQGVLTVAGRDRLKLSGDYSLICVGMLSSVLGRGADIIVCDDAFDLRTVKTSEAIERGLKWLRVQVLSRLEPGGFVFILGAKLPVANEPYTQIASWPGEAADDIEGFDEHDGDEVEEMITGDDYPRLFHTVVQPAVLDWKNKIVLCPERFTWKQMMAAKRLAKEEWEPVWMQNPGAGPDRDFKREWIFGGERGINPSDGGNPMVFPGCLDEERRLGESQHLVRSTSTGREEVPKIRVLSIDPSDRKYWCFLVADLPKYPGAPFKPILLDIDRRRHSTFSALALLDRWWSMHHFSVIVLERNMSKFFLENSEFQDFLRRTHVKLIKHWTAENKSSPVWGIRSLPGHVRDGDVRIPWGDSEAKWAFLYLVKEMLGELSTDDCLMALWFLKFNLNGLLAMVGSDAGWQGWAGRPKASAGMPRRLARAGR